MKRRAATVLVAAALVWPLLGSAAPRGTERAPPVRTEYPGKPTGPIVVDHRLAAVPTVGVPLKIEITARAEGVAGGLGIEAHPTVPSALLVTPPMLTAAGDGTYAWEITVVPLAAEAGYLSVVVSGTVDGTAQARSVTISLRSSLASREATTPEHPDGERLIALPAQESSH